jgi:hypothetical protein
MGDTEFVPDIYCARRHLSRQRHPAVFLDAITYDEIQQRASLYIHAFRQPSFENTFTQDNYALPIRAFDSVPLSDFEKAQMIAAWHRPGRVTGASNWYRAADFVVAGGSCNVPNS